MREDTDDLMKKMKPRDPVKHKHSQNKKCFGLLI